MYLLYRIGGLYPRTFYPELAAVAPQGTNNPTIQLDKPGAQAVARGALEIIWMDEPVIQVVLDQSGSMGGTPLANVKAAAQNLMDIVEVGTSVGVIAFDDTVSVAAPIVKVTNDTVRTELKTAISSITTGGNTAIGDAMQTALDGLKSYGISNRAAAVFLLSDGYSNAGVDPLDMVPAYQAAQVPVFGFGYGEEVDPRLEQVALVTDGKYFASPVGSKAVRKAFAEANAIFSDRVITLDGSTDPSGIMGFMATTEPMNIPFFVDSGMEDFRLSIVYSGANVSAVSLGLMQPDNTLLTVAPTNAPDGSILLDFHVNSPMAGEWVIVGTREPDTHISYLADAKTAWGGYHLDWIAFEQPEDSEEYLTVVSLRGEADIDGAQVTGQIRFENGETVSCVFSNFAAGLYGAMNTVTHSGYGTMTVTASNPYGTAFTTWRDAEIDTFGEEDPEPPEDEPITENFTRVVSERIYVKPFPCLFVNADRPDDSGIGNTWTNAFRNLQPAVDRAGKDTVIIVTNGVYGPVSTDNKSIIIQSVNGAGVTAIDGGGTNRCATFGTENGHLNTALTGFTLQNGNADHANATVFRYYGGGAVCGTLSNCILTNNMAYSGGGTAYGTLRDCTLERNVAGYGGGGSFNSTLANCVLSGNVAYIGGGLYLGTLNNCVVSGNTASHGGAIISGSGTNCLLYGNTATGHGGVMYGGTLVNCTLSGNTATGNGGGSCWGRLDNCIVWGNTAVGEGDNHYNTTFLYSCTEPMPTGSYNGGGNISADPLFEDALAGNFRLRMDSPCVNAGTNPSVVGTVDLDGKPRIRDGTVDMGAYEYDKLRPAPGIPVPIPFDWLDLYLGWGGLWDYGGLANATGANGYPVWESYVAGLVPTDAGSKFRIFNFRTDGTEVTALDWTPHRSDRTYTVWGKTNLTDALWHSPTNSGTRFFKVSVEL
ncbi:MAG: VWA domain-containing protein [Kiritimatiellaeota bacterium]|nr:VWA domain-containing protein [Kiritimatiellota bacterium]